MIIAVTSRWLNAFYFYSKCVKIKKLFWQLKNISAMIELSQIASYYLDF